MSERRSDLTWRDLRSSVIVVHASAQADTGSVPRGKSLFFVYDQVVASLVLVVR
jgi:hypothetical protein